MLDNFIQKLKLNNKSDNTIRSYCERLQDYFNFSNNQISQQTLDQYVIYKKASGNTLNLFLSALKKYCDYEKIELNFPENRSKEFKFRTYINEDELYNKYLQSFKNIFYNGKKESLIFKFLFYTGLRKSELFNLRRENFDFVKKEIIIKNTKTKKERKIFISKKIIKEVKEYFKHNNEINNAFNIKRYTINNIFRLINKKFNQDNKLTPHSMRRSFGRHYYLDYVDENGKKFDIYHISKFYGHSSIKQTEDYLQLDSNDAMMMAKSINP